MILDLIGKTVRINYCITGYDKFIIGKVIEEDSHLIAVKGSKDGAIFRIGKTTITEIVEHRGERR